MQIIHYVKIGLAGAITATVFVISKAVHAYTLGTLRYVWTAAMCTTMHELGSNFQLIIFPVRFQQTP